MDNSKKINVEICTEDYMQLKSLVRNIIKYGDHGNYEVERYYDLGLLVVERIFRDFEEKYPEIKEEFDRLEKERMLNYSEDDDFVPVKCNYIKCAAGMGVAGDRICFLKGNWHNPNCKKFIEIDNFLEDLKEKGKIT